MNGQGKLLAHFLRNADKLIIPVYQRNYDWREEHCQRLYADLVKTVKANDRWHFFGGIVSVSDPMGSSSDYLLIDGQQRITTVSLLLLAMANLIAEGKVTPQNKDLHDILMKRYLADEINPKQRKLKLKPIKGDQDAYERLWKPAANYNYNSNITQNYLYFYKQLQHSAVSVDQLFSAVERLQIIDITLTLPDDDPQLVFESLNSTGLELNEGDKIRNFVLMGQRPAIQEQYYEDYWNPIERLTGFDKQTTSYDVSPFIRDFLSIKQHRIFAIKDIYSAFKEYTAKQGQSKIEKVLQELLAYARRYNKLMEENHTFPLKLRASLYRLNRLESSVTRPFFMELFRLQDDGILSLEDIAEVCCLVESYLLRRILCDLPSNTLGKVFLTLCSDIKRLDGTYDHFIEKVKYVLTNKKEKAAFPTDEAFAEGLRYKNIYAMPTRYKAYIFERLENGNSAEYKEVYHRLDSGEYTIEHIIPQKLTPVWSMELGENAETIHNEWLHRLANLTLAASCYNSRYKNASFQEKRTMENGYLQSGLKMTQRIAQKEHWRLSELEERCRDLIRQAIFLWPYENSTYIAPTKPLDEVTLEDDIPLTGKRLVKYRFRGKEHETTVWVDMYLSILRELYTLDRFYLNYLAAADDPMGLGSQFGRMASDLERSAMIAEGLYVNTNTSTQYKVHMLRTLLQHYGYDPSDLVFFLHPNRDESKETGDETEQDQMRRKYWTFALPTLREKTGTFSMVASTKNNGIFGLSGIPGVQLGCIANVNVARIEIYIDTGSKAENNTLFERLMKNKADIESAYGKPLQWRNAKEIRSCRLYDERIGVSVLDLNDWSALLDFHSKQAAKLLQAVKPFLQASQS